MGLLSFDFSKVEVGAATQSDIPVNTPVHGIVDDIELSNFNGQDKFVFNQTIYVDPDDESKTVKFKTFIGPKHGWLLAQYLSAVGEDFRALSGQGLSAESLQQVIGGVPLTFTFRENEYQGKVNKQVSRVQAMS